MEKKMYLFSYSYNAYRSGGATAGGGCMHLIKAGGASRVRRSLHFRRGRCAFPRWAGGGGVRKVAFGGGRTAVEWGSRIALGVRSLAGSQRARAPLDVRRPDRGPSRPALGALTFVSVGQFTLPCSLFSEWTIHVYRYRFRAIRSFSDKRESRPTSEFLLSVFVARTQGRALSVRTRASLPPRPCPRAVVPVER
ncbi:hypothetical protein EVAR_2782_1 [Eumeta japonica]|uniref:Uncharacterized protein n=1 Tax=Eumeta variegata TaxID=151549 RepID=A0A4C1SZH0_EUMVA|nr:hypothetical protein EVAR_2782_1 [Eumeta japonica]